MAELTISASVGASPAPNVADDVRTVQTLLQNVQPALTRAVTVSGSADADTIQAIREFQRRFMANPDGRVDPDGRTLYHLNNGGVGSYVGCSPQRRKVIDRNFIEAQKWLDLVLRELGSPSGSETKRKVRNVFHIDMDNPGDGSKLLTLRSNFTRVRQGFDTPFPVECVAGTSLFAAYVILSDPTGTMYFPSGHFAQSLFQQIETVIHERTHTILQIEHDGMIGAGSIDFGTAPDDDNGFTHGQAMRNAYCYGWLAHSLQPGYVPPSEDVIIISPVHR
jgi:hypothetical protein